jgi:hypothetical protein
MTDQQHTPGIRQSATPGWLQRDPAWEEQKARLWAMTRDERVRAMNAGKLSMRLCLHWASCRPQEIPLTDGGVLLHRLVHVRRRRALGTGRVDARAGPLPAG